jgi:hypothetical protein
MRVIHLHASRGFTQFPIDTVNYVTTLKAGQIGYEMANHEVCHCTDDVTQH